MCIRDRPAAALVPLGFVALMPLASGRMAGALIFNTLIVLAAAFCVVEGVRNTADCISAEKREGTLGLLFLTDLRGYDVVLGKFVASSLRSFYGFLGTFPIIGLTLLLGGVTSGEYWRSMLALTNVLFASLSMGMLVSTLVYRQSMAVGMTALALLAWLGLPFLATITPLLNWKPGLVLLAGLSPMQALQMASAGSGYWSALLVVHALGWALLGIACVALPRVWQEKGLEASPGIGLSAQASRRRRLRPSRVRQLQEALESGPFVWLVARSAGSTTLFTGAVAVLVATGLLLALVVEEWPFLMVLAGGGLAVVAVLLKLHVAWTASELLAELRQSQWLGLLLVTPTANRDFADDLGVGFWKAFGKPLIVLAGAQALVLLTGLISGSSSPAQGLIGLQLVPAGLLWLLSLFADFYALVYAGLWFGLKSGKPVQALVRTVLLVMVAPSFFCCWLGFIPPVIIAILLRYRLKVDLRRVGTGDPGSVRISTSSLLPPPALRPPAPASPGIPPVIGR